jgi:hypothetical protein
MKNIVAILLVFSSLFASSQTQFLGAPNVTVVARGNMKVDSILYLPKREKTPTDTGALRYQISDSSLYVWTGNAWRKAKNDGTLTSVSAGTGMSFATITSTGSVSADTNILATKSWRQKGDDSLGAIIATKGTGTVTSVGSGYGINGGTITTTGTLTADTLNLATRLRLQKVGDSLGLLISNAGGGTVTGVSAGTGMSFTTITSSGAVNADTLVLSTRSWRQKGDDSLGAIIATKVNISDTATMLSPYAKTSALGLYLPLSGGTLTGGLTGTTGAFTSSGGSNTFDITHSSGSGIALNITKGGNGEGLYVNKTSGTGNAATIIGTLNATTLVKSGGTATQYLMADGTTSTLTNPVTGTGTTNTLPKFTGTSTIGNSLLSDISGELKYTGADGFRVQGSTDAFTSLYGTANNYIQFIDAAGAAGAIRYNHTDNFLSINTGTNTEKFRITSAGDVAIGNTSPSYKLDITGTLRNTTGAAFATSSGNVLVGTTVDGGSYKLDVQGALRNTTGAAFATTSGNVGIGTATANHKLHIVMNATAGRQKLDTINKASANLLRITNPQYAVDASAGILLRVFPESDDRQGAGILASGGGTNGDTDLDLFVSSGSSTSITSSLMTLKGASLLVGVGNTSPTHKLDISGTLRNTTSSYFATASGSVGIGNVAPTEKLHVTGRIRATTIDSTATAMNMLYADADGVIKKAAVPSGGITGTGISGYFPKWTGTGTQDTSQLFQLGRNIGIGTATPTFRLHLPDAGSTANQAMIAGTIFGSDGNGVTISPNSSNITIKGGQGNGLIYSGTISSVARWGINTTSISDAVLSIDGDVKIVTVDSTSTARNMLYQDANGMIKKSAVPTGLTMADDVITASGSWVATKDAGSGTTINNVAYTTNGTTKMVTVDGNFYIAETGWTDGTWITIGTIPTDYRPKKTINWNSDFIVSGAEYERSDNTDFTGACDISGQMRIKDDGTVEIIATMSTNSIAAGGTAYIIVPFQVSYIIK